MESFKYVRSKIMTNGTVKREVKKEQVAFKD
jgi:hypothetical protein